MDKSIKPYRKYKNKRYNIQILMDHWYTSLTLARASSSAEAKHGFTKSPAMGFIFLNALAQPTSDPNRAAQSTKPRRMAPAPNTTGYQTRLSASCTRYNPSAAGWRWKPPSAQTSQAERPERKAVVTQARWRAQSGGT